MKTKALPRKSTAKKTPVTTAKTANKSAIAKMAGRPAKNPPDAVRNNLWHNWLTEENYLF
jgi:hypothetical protein